jgi:hypothetical protein
VSPFEELSALVASAGLSRFRPASAGYGCSDHDAQLISLSDIQAPLSRSLIVAERAAAILAGIAQGLSLPPVEVDEPPGTPARRYRLRDGFHRYHLSLVLGFSHIPVAVRPYFDWNDL